MLGKGIVIAEVKRQLRTERAAARNRLSTDLREDHSSLVCRYAWEWLESKGIASLMAYVSFRSELDTHPLIARAWQEHREVVLPRVIPASGAMTLHVVNSWNELELGTYGIHEPMISEGTQDQVAIPLPEVVFVPGLAFDLRGGRLGYGRGYYDRLYASWEAAVKPPVWVGLAYGMQLVPEVPMDEHDAFMDMLITENGIVHCRKGE